MTTTQDPKHVRLFNPGPVEVRKEVLEAQNQWMIGHRGSDFADLYGRIHANLQKAFYRE